MSTAPELVGVPTATLQAWLAAAQTALHELTIGKRVAEASYASGEGARTVRYTAASLTELRLYIRQLQQAIDPTTAPRRRPVQVMFG